MIFYVGELKKYDAVSAACDLSDECYWRSIFWVDAEFVTNRSDLVVTKFTASDGSDAGRYCIWDWTGRSGADPLSH